MLRLWNDSILPVPCSDSTRLDVHLSSCFSSADNSADARSTRFLPWCPRLLYTTASTTSREVV